MNEKKNNDINLNIIISERLRQMGISPNLTGYCYLRSMIKDCVIDFGLVRRITKKLYIQTAEKFSSDKILKWTSIERASRNAIYNAGEHETAIIEKFGHIPTNSEFIATIADDIKMEYDL